MYDQAFGIKLVTAVLGLARNPFRMKGRMHECLIPLVRDKGAGPSMTFIPMALFWVCIFPFPLAIDKSRFLRQTVAPPSIAHSPAVCPLYSVSKVGVSSPVRVYEGSKAMRNYGKAAVRGKSVDGRAERLKR